MKKLILTGLSVLCLAFNSLALNTISITVLPNTMTNILALTPNLGSVTVKQFTFTSLGALASAAMIIDCPTNALSYSVAAYTNTVSYATNGIVTWTNSYGVVQSNNYVGGQLLTNWWLVDITNHLVAATTNNYPIRAVCAAAGNATVIYGPLGNNNGYYFEQGIWATNTSLGTNIITITY